MEECKKDPMSEWQLAALDIKKTYVYISSNMASRYCILYGKKILRDANAS